jgi:agmatinase
MERIYAGIDTGLNDLNNAQILLQSIPYDGTSTWGKGADKGFGAFLDASDNMEVYDIETDSEVYTRGVHILPIISENQSAESLFNAVYQKTKTLLESNKYLTFFGGEHSVSIGVIKAFYEKHPNLTVLHLDAHADLRKDYHGTPYNHACALHDASQHTNLIQVGIRSMDTCEKEYMDYSKTYFSEAIFERHDWMQESINQMTQDVYLTIDLDVFDPSIMPATGTPEPGGMQWNTVIRYLKMVFQQRNVVGFDIVELAPIEDEKASNFLVAKLYYKLLSYKFEL